MLDCNTWEDIAQLPKLKLFEINIPELPVPKRKWVATAKATLLSFDTRFAIDNILQRDFEYIFIGPAKSILGEWLQVCFP